MSVKRQITKRLHGSELMEGVLNGIRNAQQDEYITGLMKENGYDRETAMRKAFLEEDTKESEGMQLILEIDGLRREGKYGSANELIKSKKSEYMQHISENPEEIDKADKKYLKMMNIKKNRKQL